MYRILSSNARMTEVKVVATYISTWNSAIEIAEREHKHYPNNEVWIEDYNGKVYK